MGRVEGRIMKYHLRFTDAAADDMRNLDGSIQKQVWKKIDRLEENPFLGKKLRNKKGNNLSGFFKLYVYSKTYRIIYRLITPTHIEIIEIIGIGKRDKEEIYQTIIQRLLEKD